MYKNYICICLFDIVEDDVKRVRDFVYGFSFLFLFCVGILCCFNELEEGLVMYVVLRVLKSFLNIGKGFKVLVDGFLDVD